MDYLKIGIVAVILAAVGYWVWHEQHLISTLQDDVRTQTNIADQARKDYIDEQDQLVNATKDLKNTENQFASYRAMTEITTIANSKKSDQDAKNAAALAKADITINEASITTCVQPKLRAAFNSMRDDDSLPLAPGKVASNANSGNSASAH